MIKKTKSIIILCLEDKTIKEVMKGRNVVLV